MTLRQRLVLAFGILALFTAAVYGTLAYVVHQRQQWDQLSALLERELQRMEGVLSDRRLGVPLIAPSRGGTVVQLVSSDGRVILPRDAEEVLPLPPFPEVLLFSGGYYLVGSRILENGSSVRVGLDVTDEVRSRGELARQLVWLGALIALIAALIGGNVARRALSPLGSLAARARRIDPASPEQVEYRGPRDEVAEVANALNSALDGIRRHRDQERAFLSEVAHELAAPLTLVKGHLDAVERAPGTEEAREHLQAAREAAQELLLTSQDLLALARGELERRVHNEVFRMDELLLRLERAYPGMKVEAAGPVRVVGDPHQLLQAIRNLVRNAVQASGGAEGVRVELAEEGESVKLRVFDSGPGIPDERMERIFDRYYSGTSGAGVGLTVVSRVVEQHGGELEVETDSSGTCFTVILPSFSAQLATVH